MIKVFLDGNELDFAEDTSIALTVSITNVTEVGSTKGAYTRTIKMPATQNNRMRFGFADEVLSADAFNNANHTARIEQDGVELIEGKAYLDNVELADTEGYFSMQIVGNDFGWIENVRNKKLNELSDDKDFGQFARYSLLTPAQRKCAFFALTDSGCWWQEADSATRTDGATQMRRNWAVQADLVPFVNIDAVLRKVFTGYTVTYGIGLQWTMERLFMTGAYANQDKTGVLQDDNDFTLTSDKMDNQDDDGNVKITISHSEGDEARELPVLTTIDEDEHSRITFTGSAESRNLLAHFTPTRECNIVFNVKGKYQTTLGWGLEGAVLGDKSIAIATLATPVFANTEFFNGEKFVQYDITDSAEWEARYALNGTEGDDEFQQEGVEFTGDDVIRNWQTICPPDKMCVVCADISNPENFSEAGYMIMYDGTETYGHAFIPTTKTIEKRTFFIASQIYHYHIPNSGRYLSIVPCLKGTDGELYVQRYCRLYKVDKYVAGLFVSSWGTIYFRKMSKIGDEWKSGAVTKDLGTAQVWAVSDNQRLTFGQSVIPTTTYHLTTDEPTPLWLGVGCTNAYDMGTSVKNFNGEAGAESLTVYGTSQCSVSPKFGVIPPVFGAKLSLNDIAGDIDVSQFLKSVFQLFNVRVLTDPQRKTVHLIGGNRFYTDDVVDWTNRVDTSKTINIETLCEDIGKKYTLAYQSSSPAVEEYNDRHAKPYGEYSYDLPTKANDDTTENTNPVFNPALFTDAKEIFEAQQNDAPLLNLHARDTKIGVEDVEFEYPHTLVKVMGDYRVGYSTDTINTRGVIADYQQPRLSFEEGGDSYTLTFNDVVGDETEQIRGLRLYYDTYAQMYRTGKRITCYCAVEPQEIDAIRKYGTHPTLNFRSRYKIRINNEDILCRLESIDNYEPKNASHKCKFIYFIEK